MVYSLKDPGIRSTLLIMRVYFKKQIISTKRTVLLLCTKHTALTISGGFICNEQGFTCPLSSCGVAYVVTPYGVKSFQQ